MSRWKGDFKGFHDAGIKSASLDAVKTLREILKKEGLSNDEEIMSLVAVFEERMKPKKVAKRHPYSYGMTRGL